MSNTETQESIGYHLEQLETALRRIEINVPGGSVPVYSIVGRHVEITKRLVNLASSHLDMVIEQVDGFMAIVVKLAESDPMDFDTQRCRLCGVPLRTPHAEHASDCLWLQAKKAVGE